jgi:hypothetical protein
MENLSYFGTVNAKSKKCYITARRWYRAVQRGVRGTLQATNGVCSTVLFSSIAL